MCINAKKQEHQCEFYRGLNIVLCVPCYMCTWANFIQIKSLFIPHLKQWSDLVCSCSTVKAIWVLTPPLLHNHLRSLFLYFSSPLTECFFVIFQTVSWFGHAKVFFFTFKYLSSQCIRHRKNMYFSFCISHPIFSISLHHSLPFFVCLQFFRLLHTGLFQPSIGLNWTNTMVGL